MSVNNTGFHALHYTYIRPPGNPFPRILATPTDTFINHVEVLSRNYQIISPQEILEFYKGKRLKKTGLLFSFDDGYSDHFQAAKILSNSGIQALFFIPACLFTDKLPINPTIIHYCLAHYGIGVFLDVFHEAARKYGIAVPSLKYVKGDNVWSVIGEIKKTAKYILKPADARKILLYIYEQTFHYDFPDAMEIMYMTPAQIKEIIAMGHSIGSHTQTHFSLGSPDLSTTDIAREVITSGLTLEKLFGVKINALAYPYGEPADCLSPSKLLEITENYTLAFTVKEHENKPGDSPLDIGRYAPWSKDTADDIHVKLLKMSDNRRI